MADQRRTHGQPLAAVILALVCAPLLVGAQTGLVGEASKRVGLPPAPAHLEWFGFALIDCGFDDPTDGITQTSYLDEVAGFTNLAQLCPLAVDDALGWRLDLLASAGPSALLSVDAILFEVEPDSASPSGLKTSLRSDATLRWAQFLVANAGQLTPERIAAVSIVDEPTWNGLPPEDLELAAALIQATLPALPTLIVEAGPAVASLVVPESVDWLAFDRYGVLHPAQDPTFLADLATLKSKLTRPGQRILLIPETRWLPLYASHGVQPGDMGSVLLETYLLAVSDPDVIGLVGYLWPSGFDQPGQLGARHLPADVQELLRCVGQLVVN